MSEYVICQINYCDKQRYSPGGWKVALNLFRIRIRFWMLFENHLKYYFVVIVLLVVIPETKLLFFFQNLACCQLWFLLFQLFKLVNKFVSERSCFILSNRANLPSVAETNPKINQSRCNLQFSICKHARGKVLSLENHHSLFKDQDILFTPICWTRAHGASSSLEYQLEEPSFRFSKKSYANNDEANGLNFFSCDEQLKK